MLEPDEIGPEMLKKKLSEISQKAHYIYALMCGLPKDEIYVHRYFDNRTKRDGDDHWDENTFSVKEFLAVCDSMHPDDSLGITFSLRRDKIDAEDADNYAPSETPGRPLTLKSLQGTVNRFLKSYCERSLLRNRSFTLTPDTIKHFGFTDEDVQVLGPKIERINASIIKRLRSEYKALGKLDFIREEPVRFENFERLQKRLIEGCIATLRLLRTAEFTEERLLIRVLMRDQTEWGVGTKEFTDDCAIDLWVDRAEYTDEKSFTLHVSQFEPDALNSPVEPIRQLTLHIDRLMKVPFVPPFYLSELDRKLRAMCAPKDNQTK